jgi:hypothetical protein
MDRIQRAVIMARQHSIFGLVDGDTPDEANELKFIYDPEHPGQAVKVTFPSGTRKVSPDKLAELGILCLALAGTTEAENAFELLQGFELPAPFFMHLELLANRIARRMVQALIDTYPAIRRDYASDEKKQKEFEAGVAKQIITVMRANA